MRRTARTFSPGRLGVGRRSLGDNLQEDADDDKGRRAADFPPGKLDLAVFIPGSTSDGARGATYRSSRDNRPASPSPARNAGYTAAAAVAASTSAA